MIWTKYSLTEKSFIKTKVDFLAQQICVLTVNFLKKKNLSQTDFDVTVPCCFCFPNFPGSFHFKCHATQAILMFYSTDAEIKNKFLQEIFEG